MLYAVRAVRAKFEIRQPIDSQVIKLPPHRSCKLLGQVPLASDVLTIMKFVGTTELRNLGVPTNP